MDKTLLNQLPEEVQKEVLKTLKAFDEVYVVFEYGKYNVSTGIALKKTYGVDHRTIGTIKAIDVYTEDERTENYIECFHDYPIWYKGKRDYIALKEKFS